MKGLFRNKQGSSLLEIVVAIAILGLMVAPVCSSLVLSFRLNADSEELLQSRLLVESTFTGSRLDALERFFGHSVDPERGKPTNKEFLAQLQQRLMTAHARLRGG